MRLWLKSPNSLIKLGVLILVLGGGKSAFTFEIKGVNTLDTWYGNWISMFGKDSGGISENILSVRVFESNPGHKFIGIKGEFDILYATYWDQGFHLKDTTSTHILWKKLEFESPSVSVVFGDFYSTFGQGFILGMEPDVAFQRERFIEGLKVGTKLAKFELVQLWGVPYEIDRLQKKYELLNDTSDVFFGAEVSYELGIRSYNFSFSGRGLRLNLEDTLYTNLCGGGFEFKSNWGSWYIEWTKKFGWDRIDYVENGGAGFYSSIDIIPYGINLRFMDYDTMSIGGKGYKYNLLPVLNQSGYQIDEGLIISRNGIGFQIALERVIKDVLLNLSHSQIWNKDTKSIVEYYLKTEYMGFYGSLKFLSLVGGVDLKFEERHQLGCEIYSSFKNVETTLSLDKVKATWIDSLIPFSDIGLSIQFPIWKFFTMYLDYLRRSKEVIEEYPGMEWYGIGMKVEPSSSRYIGIELWVGNERGGFVCSGGVCRWVAPFEGFKLKLNISL